MDPMEPIRKKSASKRAPQRRRWEEEDDYEMEMEEEFWEEEDPYREKMIRGRNQRGPVRRYLREETSFFHDVTIGPCKRIARMSCNTISYIGTFFSVCFFIGMVLKIFYTFYSFFV